MVCPSGWVCQAVLAPGVKWTLAAPRREGSEGVATVSTKTVPVNHSPGPGVVSALLLLVICMLFSVVGDSAGGVAAIDGKCDTEHEAGCRAAEPKHGRGDLVRASQPADRLIGLGLGHVELAPGDHAFDHRGLDSSRADRVDADAAGSVLEGRALGEADDAVFGGVVGGAARESDQAAERGAVDDGAAALRAHRPQLVFHARPDAAQVDRVDAVEGLGRFVGGAWMPALLNAKSSRPKLATLRSTSAATCSSSETSQTTPSA